MHRVLFAALAFALFADSQTFAARFRTEVVSIAGDPAPDGNGDFYSYFLPSLNDAGQVAFGALRGNVGDFIDRFGIYLNDTGTLTQLLGGDIPAPDPDTRIRYADYSSVALNNSGQIGFRGVLNSSNGDIEGVFFSDGERIFEIVRQDQPALDGNGSFSEFGNVLLNDSGRLTFPATFSGTSGGYRDDTGIFQADGFALTQNVRENQAESGSMLIFDDQAKPAHNNAGQIAFQAHLRTEGGSIQRRNAIFRNEDGMLTQIVLEGDEVPRDDHAFWYSESETPALNDSGQVAFRAILRDAERRSVRRAILVGDGSAPLIEIVRELDFTPNGNGAFSTFNDPVLNNVGQVAFLGRLRDETPPSFEGIFRGDGTLLQEIARSGQPALDGNGQLSHFYHVALNDKGQVAFMALSSGNRGVFLYDDVFGLMQVAQTGQEFLGSSVTDIQYFGQYASLGDQRSGFNNLGQVAYWFELADGRQGIAIATLIPEPSSLTLLGFICLAAVCTRRGARPQG